MDDAPPSPDRLLDDALDWAVRTVGERLDGPAEVLNRNPWGGVTAAVRLGGRELVVKASVLPELRHSGRLAELLWRVAPESVPELVAWSDESDRAYTLFARFAGRSVVEVDRLEPTLEMARALARVQAAFAELPPPALAGLPRVDPRDVPAALDGLLADVDDRFWGWWREDGHDARFGVPPDIVPRMRGWAPRLAAWADELASGPVPASVDHVDFLPHNAVLKADGRVLVYDWEQAVVGCPLFSLDVLFLYAQQIGRGDDWLVEPERDTAETRAVRRAYLDALPWGTPAERERAFDLAMCLSPLRYARTEQAMAARHGQERGWSNDMAWWLTRALNRWERLPATSSG
jgi:hypothetical protein